jgi:FkbM family methyltransferase
MKLPILVGPLRGQWWLSASGGKLLRVLNGSYEREQTRFFRDRVRPGMTVLDVGAHVGYYTLLSARLVGTSGRVVAFEPQPRNCAFLRGHVTANGLANVRVEEAAVADASGFAPFQAGTGTGTGHLAESGSLAVRTIRLDEFCRDHEVSPAVMKIDVEGAELSVLSGAAATIARTRPIIFLSTHGAAVHNACLVWLHDHGYETESMLGAEVATTTELLCTPRTMA